jgi:tetratricopeptide (TPR) repeat protein
MDSQRQQMEWIGKYLENRMEPGELEVFERMLREDVSFRELVNDTKLLISGIQSSARDSMKEEIRNWESGQPDLSQLPKRLTSNKALRIGWMSLAAAACLTAFLYFGALRTSPDERAANTLFSDYYDGAYQNVVALTFRSDARVITAHQEAFAAYDLDDYRKASKLFSEIPQQSDTVLFYLGNSWMALKEYQKAGDCFRSAIEKGGFMVDQSRWYLSLSLLKSGHQKEAEPIFRELSAYPNFYQSKAKQIAARLSDFTK